MMRPTRVLSMVGLAFVLLLPVLVQAAPQVGRAGVANAPLTRLSRTDLRLSVERGLQARKLSVANRRFLTNNLEAMPLEVQATAAALLDPAVAETVGRPELSLGRATVSSHLAKVDPRIIELLTRPFIDATYPASGGSPGDICVVVGGNYLNSSVVTLDGTAMVTYYWCNTIVLFRMPETAVLGRVYQVAVKTPTTNKTSPSVPFKVVAPRGFRGVHGLQFANFGAAAIPWSVYAFVFGKANVEFANGTHRPSAQTWYDDTFKGVGGNGNCWGMSQMSHRLRKYLQGDGAALDRVCNSAWVKANVGDSVWSMPWAESSKQAVQSLQCLQLVNPMATYCNNQKASQNNNTAWDFANSSTTGNPVQNTLYGHAVITWDTELTGTSRKFCFYDNNNPYSETEVSGSDPNHGVTVSNTGTFTYGGYLNTRCYDPNQLMGVPTLPAGVGGDGSASDGSAPVRFEVPRVAGLTISDEAGRGGADGAGVPGLSELTPDMGLGPIPATFPRIFLLSGGQNRSLSFTVPNPGRQPLKLTVYSRGGIAIVRLNGASVGVSFSRFDGPNAQISIPDPQGAGLQELQFIAPISRNEERQIIVDGFAGLGNRAVGASLSADRSAVEILNSAGAQPLQLRLRIQRFEPRGGATLPAVQQTIAAGQLHLLGPSNWATLQVGQLRSIPAALPANRLRTR